MDRSRRPILFASLLLLAIASILAGFQLGLRHPLPTPVTSDRNETLFRIRGESMSPTLLDGQICRIVQPKSNLRIGDIVAVKYFGSSHVKRIAGLPGDTVDVRRGRLFRNGERLEDCLAKRIDEDWIRPTLVTVSTNTTDWSLTANGNWLVYTHHNPHQAGRLTAIHDDYPRNTSVKRILNRVDRLALRFPDSERLYQDASVGFYCAGNVVLTRSRLGVAMSREGTPVETDHPLQSYLDQSHPVAVSVKAFGDAADTTPQREFRRGLHVLREIEYRDDVSQRHHQYPIKLAAGQIFVVGDNVPVSVDSREAGPIPTASVIGRVKRVDPGVEASVASSGKEKD